MITVRLLYGPNCREGDAKLSYPPPPSSASPPDVVSDEGHVTQMEGQTAPVVESHVTPIESHVTPMETDTLPHELPSSSAPPPLSSSSSSSIQQPMRVAVEEVTPPFPGHVTEEERTTLEQCLTRWRQEVINTVHSKTLLYFLLSSSGNLK